jgi:hypothetical protein
LPAVVVQPVVPHLPPTVEPTAYGVAESPYRLFEVASRRIPGVSGRQFIVTIFGLILLMSAYLWVGLVSVVTVPALRVVRALLRSERTTTRDTDSVFPFVRRLDTVDTVTPVRLFGWTMCVFLPPHLVEAGDDELRETVQRVTAVGRADPRSIRVVASLARLLPGGRTLYALITPTMEGDGAAHGVRHRHGRHPPDAEEHSRLSTDGSSERSTSTARRALTWVGDRLLAPLRLFYGVIRPRRRLDS